MPMAAQTTSHSDETVLVAGARSRDERAVRALIQTHNRRMYRVARSILRSDHEAEDVLQEAYVKAFTQLARFRGDATFGTWLCRIVMNEAFGRLRQKSQQQRVSEQLAEISARIIPFPVLGAPQLDPEQKVAHDQIRNVLERAIDRLPERFRCVLVARLVEQMSVEETAQLFDIREETVKTRLHRARHLLRHALEDAVGPHFDDAFPFDGRRCQRMTEAVLDRLAGPNPAGTF